MILTIDVGNTNTVIGIFAKEELIENWRVATDKDKTPDEYGVMLYNLFDYSGLEKNKVDGVIISSVVPPVVSVLEEMSVLYFKENPLVIGPGIKTGINIKTDNPREVGADRVVNAAAGYYKYQESLIIIDFGTATTFCAVSEQGEYLGGAIAPGIGISTDALFSYASKLPRVNLENPGQAVGKNTISSMQSGIVYGFVGQVEKLISLFKKEMKKKPRVIATGGFVDLIYQEIEVIDSVEPYLTLEGLYYIGRLNGIVG